MTEQDIKENIALDAIKNPQKFMLFESTQIPLVETTIEALPNKDRVLANMINPISGKPYEDGILLSGVFADLRQVLNNNNRIYSIPEYVELVEKLYTQIFSKRGLFGEFEHPEKYNTDGKKVSHKILDIFYDQKTQMVYGTVLVLDTPNGKIVKEIIKSGGLVCISARAAGSEEKQPDGTFRAITKVLVTYDLVMNPGFSAAELDYIGQPKDFAQLYESIQNLGNARKGFSVMLYEAQMEHFNSAYSDYISLNENLSEGCFIQWYAKHNLLESEDITPEEEEDFEDMQIPKQKQQEKKLQKVTDAQLKEEFLDSSVQALTGYYKKVKSGAGSVYDNSAGFLDTDPDSIEVPTGNTFQSFLDMCEQESNAILLNQESKKPKVQKNPESKIQKPEPKKSQVKKPEPKVQKAEPQKAEPQKPQTQTTKQTNVQNTKVQKPSQQSKQEAKSVQQKPKQQGLKGSDYLNKQQTEQKSKQTDKQQSKVDNNVQKPDVDKVKQQKPKTKLSSKIKQKAKAVKDSVKKNSKYYLNWEMDDGNSNAGKPLIEK